ncbi:hypothetical protein A2U01_0006662, partial [Trifolium medium]|nr:hypothetical protein [Trifolium medium]
VKKGHMLPKARDGEDFMERGKTLADTNLGSSDTKEHLYEMSETGQKWLVATIVGWHGT